MCPGRDGCKSKVAGGCWPQESGTKSGLGLATRDRLLPSIGPSWRLPDLAACSTAVQLGFPWFNLPGLVPAGAGFILLDGDVAKAGLDACSGNELQISSSCWVLFCNWVQTTRLVLNKTEQTTTQKRRGKQSVLILGLLRELIISRGGHSIWEKPRRRYWDVCSLRPELCWCSGLAMCGLSIASPAVSVTLQLSAIFWGLMRPLSF